MLGFLHLTGHPLSSKLFFFYLVIQILGFLIFTSQFSSSFVECVLLQYHPVYDNVFNFLCIELEYLTMQYWATSASSLSVLVFLCMVIWRSPDRTRLPYSRSVMDAKLSLSGIVLFAVVCCVSIAATSHTGEFVILHPFLLFLSLIIFCDVM